MPSLWPPKRPGFENSKRASPQCRPVPNSPTPTGKNMLFWGIPIRWKSTQRRAAQEPSFNRAFDFSIRRPGRITRRTARRCSRTRSARPRRNQAPHRPGVPPGIAGAPRRAGAGVGATPRRENHQDSHPRHETQVGGMPHAHRRRRVQPRAHQAPATRHRIFGVARTRSLDRGIPQRTLSGHPHRAHAGLAGSRGDAKRTPLMAAASDGRKSMSPL